MSQMTVTKLQADSLRKPKRKSGISMLRQSCGLSAAKLAAKSGSHLETIRAWEYRGLPKQAFMLVRIAQVLGCTVEELVKAEM